MSERRLIEFYSNEAVEAAQPVAQGDGGLANEFRRAMKGWRVDEYATVAPTIDEWLRVNAMLTDWLCEPDPGLSPGTQ